ncbi:MAG: WYL domain-containing transcriptional regulator [Clostridia bacterium]|nr:WYL domain-containing transcriptional regulator [Clostridia bacterium]
MREFYIYGFKSRDDYSKKSSRSYDDERRRIESWLGDHMSFVRTPEGKNVFISIDSRSIRHNPFYNAWKAKSFTDGDVTLHFIIFDILNEPSVKCTLSEIMREIDEKYLSKFEKPMIFDESTVRKKLKEYTEAGIIVTEKVGRKVSYSRSEDTDVKDLNEVLHFYSEVAPCGVIGSFILDKEELDTDAFTFKHHYITGAIDSGVLASIFTAMREKRIISVSNLSRRKDTPRRNRIIPLRVFISVQSGRQHLLAYLPGYNNFQSYRIDYLSNIKLEEVTPRFDELRAQIDEMKDKMWGVSTKRNKWGIEKLEHVDFTVRVADDEAHIIRRLEREKRVGKVEKIDDNIYRFTADVYDVSEMIPWIRTFICRIIDMNFTSKTLENQFNSDLDAMYRMYGIEEVSE